MMDIKNFVSRFSTQHKIIALAGFVCLAVFASAIIFNLASRNADSDAYAASTPEHCATPVASCYSVGATACSSTKAGEMVQCLNDPRGYGGSEWVLVTSRGSATPISNLGDCPAPTAASVSGKVAGAVLGTTCDPVADPHPASTPSVAAATGSTQTDPDPNAKSGSPCMAGLTAGDTVCNLAYTEVLTCNGTNYSSQTCGSSTSPSPTCAYSAADGKHVCSLSAATSSGDCVGASVMKDCDLTAPLDQTCGRDDKGQYSYCEKRTSTKGKCAFTANKDDYCRVCGSVELSFCSCDYKPDTTSPIEKISMGVGQKKCAKDGTPFENYEVVCETGSGDAKKNPCLNMGCDKSGAGTGCVIPEDIGCNQMNQDVVTLINYYPLGRVTFNEVSGTVSAKIDVKGVKDPDADALLTRISSNGLSANKIINHVYFMCVCKRGISSYSLS